MPMNRGRWPALAAFAWLVISGCRAPAEQEQKADPPIHAAGASQEAPRPSLAAPEKAKTEKEYAATATERLGTLPEGVGVATGQPAPNFTAESSGGQRVSLTDLTAKGPVLLVFYRGGWCPFCSFQIHELVTAYPEFRRRGVTPVAISVDKVEEAAKAGARYEIPFPVLSDPDLAAHQAFRVVHRADDAEVERLRGFGTDVEKASGRIHHDFAIPSLFLIDRAGRVRWAHADPDYKTRPRVAHILAAIDAAKL